LRRFNRRHNSWVRRLYVYLFDRRKYDDHRMIDFISVESQKRYDEQRKRECAEDLEFYEWAYKPPHGQER